jgi:hypothetical protein
LWAEEGEPVERFVPRWNWTAVIGGTGRSRRGVVPESEDAPDYLHEWKPDPGRDELKHQVV